MLVTKHDNPYRVVDRTDELMVIPNQWGLVNQLGIFQNQYVTGNTFYVDRHIMDFGVLVDLPRGTKPAAGREDKRERRHFSIPHFPIRQAILPSDIAQQSSRGTGEVDSIDLARAEKMEFIRRTLAMTTELARCKMLTTGEVYAPNGNVVLNAYTEFGVTRKDIDFKFGTSTEDPLGRGEEAIAHIQDNLNNGGVYNGAIALWSPAGFTRLINHPNVKAAYQMYASTQEPYRNRLGGNTTYFREFDFGGIRHIEYRGGIGAEKFIPDGECRILPTGTDFFKTYYGSAERFGLVNVPAQEAYYFEKMSEDDDQWTIDAETNMANMVLNPAVVVRGYSSN